MMKTDRLLIVLSFFLFAMPLSNLWAQKVTEKSDFARPPWMQGEFPPKTNESYNYKVISDVEGATIQDAKKNAFIAFVTNYASSRKINISGEALVKIKSQYKDNESSEKQDFDYTYNIKYDDFEVSFEMVDSYWEKYSDGNYMFWALYEVANNVKNYEFEQIEYSTSYGASAAWRSAIVPGWGQLYKKQNRKGYTMLVTTGVLATGFLFSQMNFAKNYDKAMEYRGVNNTYYATYKANYEDWNKIRTAIGIGYGVYWTLGLIDSFRSRGAKRYVKNNSFVQLYPTFDLNYCSLTLKLNLK
jgi:hypothetical protein